MPGANFKIKAGTERHRKILKALRERIDLSRNKMKDMTEDYKKAEDLYRTYIPERDVDAERRIARETNGEHSYRTVVVPYSYAMLMAAHTYWTSVFMSRQPIFQFQASHGLVKGNPKAIEAVMDYQLRIGTMLPALYLWLLDVGKYGLGIVHEQWHEQFDRIAQIVEKPGMFMGILPTGKTTKQKIIQEVKGYHGNKLTNIRPQHWFPDTRKPLQDFQEGEFCGHYVEIGWNDLVEGESNGTYFNIDWLRKVRNRGGGGGSSGATSGGSESGFMPEEGSVDAPRHDPTPNPGVPSDEIKNLSILPSYKLCVRLIPKEWALGKGDLPELWQFVIGENRDIIVQARPRGELHNKFPYSTMHLEPSGYELTSRGMLQIAKPLQDVMDWLFNTHMYNVRKTMNNQIVVDPSKLVMGDVLNPLPGGVWRLKPSAWGTDPKLAYSQVEMVDITRNHIGDSNVIASLLQRALGVADPVLGGSEKGGRQTATQIRTDTAFSTNRLKTQAEYFSAVGWQPLSMRMLQNTQQYYDGEMMFRVAGDLMAPGGAEMMNVTPDDISGFYDFMPVDGTLPIDRFAQANLWRELMGQLRFFPQLMAEWDISGLFSHVLQISGLKNANQFKIQVQPDAAVAGALQAGNVIPSGGANGGGNAGNSASGSSERFQSVSEPGQLSGMGSTG